MCQTHCRIKPHLVLTIPLRTLPVANHEADSGREADSSAGRDLRHSSLLKLNLLDAPTRQPPGPGSLPCIASQVLGTLSLSFERAFTMCLWHLFIKHATRHRTTRHILRNARKAILSLCEHPSALTQTYLVPPTPPLSYMVQPTAPRLQARTARTVQNNTRLNHTREKIMCPADGSVIEH